MLVELTGSHFSHIITIKVNRYSGYYQVADKDRFLSAVGTT